MAPAVRRRPQLWLFAALLALAATALTAAPALAAGTVRLSSATFSARESDRAATVTVERSVVSGHGEVRYAIWQHSAVENVELRACDAGGSTSPTARRRRRSTCRSSTTTSSRTPRRRPLASSAPTRRASTRRRARRSRSSTTTCSARATCSTRSRSIRRRRETTRSRGRASTRPVAESRRHGHQAGPPQPPQAAALLRVIAEQPETKRFGAFNDQPGAAVAQHLATARRDDPGAVR